jgi:NtrC-family two-component system sensor histidine kinase KinB
MSIALAAETLDDFTDLARAYVESQAFVSLLAHELRTRLKVTEKALAASGEDGRRAALENTQAVQELLESLLELARGQAGERTEAGAAMQGVLGDLAEDPAPNGPKIVVHDLPVVALPQMLAKTVLRNLVLNALEAGASRVDVFARPDGTICVRDNGPGVSRASAARIFGAYSTKFGGSGLGLALCREIVRRRGGDLWLEAPSTFCFSVS